MYRKEFIKLNILAGLGLSVLNIDTIKTQPSNLLLTGRKRPLLGSQNLLQKTAHKAFAQMHRAALEDDIDIRILSGYRHFNDQLKIWNRKYTHYKKKNLAEEDIFNRISTYSAIPGTSRHHWGTEIDIIDSNAPRPKAGFLVPQHYQKNGIYSRLYEWMNKNGPDFGFYLVYTDNKNRMGFNFEPWHYSFEPLAKNYLKLFARMDLEKNIKDQKIGGNNYFDKNCLLSYFHTHLLGINPNLLP